MRRLLLAQSLRPGSRQVTIGRHECKKARDTDLARAVAIGLDEALTALEESFHDLADEHLWDFPIEGRNNIAWIVMHCLMNLDIYAVLFQTGQGIADHWDKRWHYNAAKPEPSQTFPPQKEMLEKLRALRTIVERDLAEVSEAKLMGKRHAQDWWPGTAADAYMRTIFHRMAHIRQIWLLRGALKLTDGKSWPRQHWA